MEVIVFESEAFEKLVCELHERFANQLKEEDLFVDEKRAREILHCGKTHLNTLKNTGKIKFFKDDDHPKHVLFEVEDLYRYLQENCKAKF